MLFVVKLNQVVSKKLSVILINLGQEENKLGKKFTLHQDWACHKPELWFSSSLQSHATT